MTLAPQLAGPYVHVYRPGPDLFPGPDSPSFRAGRTYNDWVPNDHTIVKGPDDRWHAFGITHPAPPPPAAVHEAEWMAFHTASPVGKLKEQLRDGAWEDLPKVLSPSERLNETKELYAPFIVERDGRYHMFYGPSPMRRATSADLFGWVPQGAIFSQEGAARDPCVFYHDGEYIMVYVAGHSVWARTSASLEDWSVEPREIFRMNRPGAPESPVLVCRGDTFYLFWCIYDGTHGPYDHRTFVYASRDPFDFHDAEPISTFNAHAPEVFQNEDGGWFVSSVEWPHRGLSIAPLEWA